MGCAAGAGCAETEGSSPKEAAKTDTVVMVQAQRPDSQSVARVERRSARAEAQREVSLAFGVPGRVSRVNADEGERVKKGALLAAVDTRALAAQVAQAEAGLAQAEREAKRARALLAKKAVSTQRVDQLGSALEMAKAQLDAAQAQLDQARIRAPFDADVVRRMAEPGAWANPGVPMLHLAALDPIRVVALVPDQVRPHIQKGAAAEVTARGLAEARSGEVIRVSPVADPRTGLFRVEIDVPNSDRRIAAGQPVEVAMDAGQLSDAVVLQPEWLVYRYDGPAVMVIDQGKARTVLLGRDAVQVDGKFVVSKQSLPPLPIITKGHSLAREGGAVRQRGDDSGPVATEGS